MAHVVKALEKDAKTKTCMTFLKPDLQAAAKKLDLAVSGNKDELCKRILQKMKRHSKEKKKEKVEAFSREKRREIHEEKKEVRKEEDDMKICMSHTAIQLKGFLEKLGVAGISKLTTKEKRCNELIKRGYKWKYEEEEKKAPLAKPAHKIKSKSKSPDRPTKAFQPNYVKTTVSIPQMQKQLAMVATYMSSQPACAMVRNSFGSLYTFQQAMQFILNELTKQSTRILPPAEDVANQQFMQCFVKDVLARSQDRAYRDGGVPSVFQLLKEDVKEFFKCKRIGTESNFGSAFLVYARNGATHSRLPIAVMKLVLYKGRKFSNPYCEALHELVIGFALNTLRSKIPTFTYTYGGFYCDLKQSENGPECSERNEQKSTLLTLQESITAPIGGKDFFKLMYKRKLTRKEIVKHCMDIFKQVAHALYIANKELAYMHFDLHSENVLLQELDVPMDVVCKTDKYNFTLRDVRFIPRIIDYGMSVCTINGNVIHSLQFSHPEDLTRSCKYLRNEVMQNLGGCQGTYNYPTYDIWRYCTAMFVELYYVAGGASEKFGDIAEEVFYDCQKPVFGLIQRQAEKADNDSFKRIATWGFISFAGKIEDDDDRYYFGLIKDSEVWKKDCGDWLNHVMKYK